MIFHFDGVTIHVPRAQLPPISKEPVVSIVIATYRRPAQLEATLESIAMQTYKKLEIIVVEDGYAADGTTELCQRFGAIYIQRRARPNRDFSNPAIPWNIGIRRAVGEILVLQCAECRYNCKEDLAALISPVISDSSVSSYATVQALDPNGHHLAWYAGPETHPDCYLNFCQAVSRQAVMNIEGFDESFTSWGADDCLIAFQLQYSGIDCRYVPNVLVTHQWHAKSDKTHSIADEAYYHRRIAAIKAGAQNVANAGRNWGNPSS